VREEKTQNWNRSIVALLVSIFTSTAGALVCTTALGKQVYDMTHQPLQLGLLGLAEFAPSALLVLVSGAVADRFSRTRVSSAAALLEVFAGIGLALYASTHPKHVLPIYGMVLVFGVGRAFYAPANRALPADMVPPEHLPWLTARRGATWQSGIIIGPIVGGFLYAANIELPYVVMATLLAVASASMFFVTVPEQKPAALDEAPDEPAADPGAGHAAPARRGTLRDAFEGLRFIKTNPLLLGAISLDLFAVLFGGAVALLPAIATDRLHVGAVGFGWLRAAGGIGAAAVTLVITRRPVEKHVGRSLLIAVGIFGAFTIVLGSTRIYAVAFIAMVALSGADAISVFVRSTLVPLITPFDKRGRVLAVESVFIGASNELGAFESGVTGQIFGAPGAVIIGGAATLVVAGTYALAFPTLRDLDNFPQEPL
jgi:MFS family permease